MSKDENSAGSEIESSIVSGVDEGLRRIWREEAETHGLKAGTYYPSSIGACLRKQHYAWVVGAEPSIESLTTFATGRAIHEAVATALEKSSIVKVEAKELEVTLDFGEARLHGRIDVLVATVKGELIIVEVKSITGLPDTPYDHQVLQLQAYLHALKMEKGVLLYWDKHRGEKRGFLVIRDSSAYQKLRDRVTRLHAGVVANTPPAKEAVLDGRLWECRMCEFQDICKPFLIPGIEPGPIVICDLDMTLFDSRERMKSVIKELGLPESLELRDLVGDLRRRFWEIFLSEKYVHFDKPISGNIERAKTKNNLIILTGRPERMREATVRQLQSVGLPYKALIMKRDDEFITDVKFKLREVEGLLKVGYTIEEFIDDQTEVVEAVKKLVSQRSLFASATG